MPAAKDASPPIPPIAEDVAALKDLLVWMRAEHWSIHGQVILGRIQVAGLVDEHPRRLVQQQEAASPSADDMDLFR